MKGFSLFELMLTIFISSLIAVASLQLYCIYYRSHRALQQATIELTKIRFIKQFLERYCQAAYRAHLPSLRPRLQVDANHGGFHLTGIAPDQAQLLTLKVGGRLTIKGLSPRFKQGDLLVLWNKSFTLKRVVLSAVVSYRKKQQQLSLAQYITDLVGGGASVSRWQSEYFYWNSSKQILYEQDYKGRRYKLLQDVKNFMVERLQKEPGLLINLQLGSERKFGFVLPLVRK